MQITVQFVNQPKPGMTFGSIKTTDGAYFNVEGEDLHKFRGGQSFDFAPREVTAKATGKKFYWVPKGFDPGAGPLTTPLNHQQPAPTSPPYPPTATNQPAPPRPAGNGNRADGFRSPRQMFICEVAAAYFSTGKVDASEATEVVRILGEAWDLHG